MLQSGEQPAGIPIATIKNDYLPDIEAELEPKKPRKKTKAEKRAEKREKKRLQLIEEKKLLMRHDLRRELDLSKRMEYKGSLEWQTMCQQIKVSELRNELYQWNEQFQYKMQCKNEKITFYIDEIEFTNDLQKKLYSNTIELMNYIIACYKVLVNTLRNVYDVQVEEVLKIYYEEIKQHSEEANIMKERSENVIHASNVLVMNSLKQDYNIYMHKREDLVNTEIANRFELRDQVVRKMKIMQKNLNKFVDSLRNTELDAHKYERIHWLTDRQLVFITESKKLAISEILYTTMINDIQHEILNLQTNSDITIKDLELELSYFTNLRQKLERELRLDRNITREKLRVLTTTCYALITDMEKHAKRGELLLSLSINCRKLQTQSEKVVVGGTDMLSYNYGDIDERFKVEVIDLKNHVDETEEQLIEEYKLMHNFWRRQVLVETQNLLLLEEKERLTKENNRYINFIRSMKVTNDVADLEALLTVSPCADPQHTIKTTCRKYEYTK